MQVCVGFAGLYSFLRVFSGSYKRDFSTFFNYSFALAMNDPILESVIECGFFNPAQVEFFNQNPINALINAIIVCDYYIDRMVLLSPERTQDSNNFIVLFCYLRFHLSSILNRAHNREEIRLAVAHQLQVFPHF